MAKAMICSSDSATVTAVPRASHRCQAYTHRSRVSGSQCEAGSSAEYVSTQEVWCTCAQPAASAGAAGRSRKAGPGPVLTGSPLRGRCIARDPSGHPAPHRRLSHPLPRLRMHVRSHSLRVLRGTPARRTVRTPVRTRVRAGTARSGRRTHEMSTALRIEDREQRLSRARAALGAAERSAARWGGRIDRTALRSPQSVEDTADDGLGTRLPVPGPLQALFPRGSLRAGSSVALEGAASTSLLLSLAVAAARADSWCAIAGLPALGAGPDPCRLALAPAGGDQRPQVLSALADGVGLLVLGPDLELAPALWRSLLGRARAADTLVLASGPPGRADLTLRATAQGWT